MTDPIDLDPRTHPVMTVSDAARVLLISRGSAYEAIKAGEIPSIRLGRRLVVPTAALLRMIDSASPNILIDDLMGESGAC